MENLGKLITTARKLNNIGRWANEFLHLRASVAEHSFSVAQIAQLLGIIEEENAITVKDLKIDGNDLINEFNLNPGPLIGKILNYLLDLILDEPELNNREFLMEKTKNFLESNNIKDGV